MESENREKMENEKNKKAKSFKKTMVKKPKRVSKKPKDDAILICSVPKCRRYGKFFFGKIAYCKKHFDERFNMETNALLKEKYASQNLSDQILPNNRLPEKPMLPEEPTPTAEPELISDPRFEDVGKILAISFLIIIVLFIIFCLYNLWHNYASYGSTLFVK